jgi:hypothetical protein
MCYPIALDGSGRRGIGPSGRIVGDGAQSG